MGTALSIMQDVLDRLCLSRQITYIDLSDDIQRQILALINEEGKELVASFDWQVLVKESAEDAADDNNRISDQGLIETRCPNYKRICDNCLYLDGIAWPLIGPMTISARTFTKASGMSVLNGYFIQNGHLYLTQPTSSTQQIRIAYISKNWVKSESETEKEKLSTNTDIPLFDDRLLTLGAVWRYLSRNGLPYQQEWLNYNSALTHAKAADRPHMTIGCSYNRKRYDPRKSILGGTAFSWQ